MLDYFMTINVLIYLDVLINQEEGKGRDVYGLRIFLGMDSKSSHNVNFINPPLLPKHSYRMVL